MARYYLPPWRIEVTRREGVRSPLAGTEIARVAARALEAAGAPSPASLAVILADDRELAALNEEHMGHTGATDVLSFPLLPPDAFPPHIGGDDAAISVQPTFVLPPGTRQHLGDIVVSVERAAEQATEGRGGQTSDMTWSVKDELRLLVVHGVLHVCGWDHARTDERDAMRALEQELLASA